MRKLLWIVLGSFALLQPAFAQIKIAIVDVDKVLEEYYKTAEAKVKIESMQMKVQAQLKSEQDRGLAMLDDIQKYQSKAKTMDPDKATADRMKREFDEKVRAVKAHSQSLEAQKKDLAAKLQKQISRLNENILLEVCSYIKKFGESQGYDLVFNQSVKNPGASDVMYVKSATDITAPVVKALNGQKAQAVKTQ